MRNKANLGLAWLWSLFNFFIINTRLPALEPNQVLLVYNHFDADSKAIRDHYLQSRPGVAEFDLAERELVGRHTVPYDFYRQFIRFPLRRLLAANPGMAERIICIVLTKGIPHRIEDMNHPLIGDDAGGMRAEWIDRGDFTAASVDSEMTLLWQDLERNESGGAFDSKADGFIVNPYYGKTEPIAQFDRHFITQPKQFGDIVKVGSDSETAQGGWEAVSAKLPSARLTPGDIYLVARLDGKTAQDVIAAIDRAHEITADPQTARIVLDANAQGDLDKGDYERTADLLNAAGWKAIYDRSPKFLTGDKVGGPVLAYASYGLNDRDPNMPSSGAYISTFRFLPGAIFNTLESFSGRDFGGAGDRAGHEQTQLAEFIHAGGTLGVGNVWEPFSFTAANNELLLGGFLLRGMSFVEAAYASLPVLSWQQIVVGDPLARLIRVPPHPSASK